MRLPLTRAALTLLIAIALQACRGDENSVPGFGEPGAATETRAPARRPVSGAGPGAGEPEPKAASSVSPPAEEQDAGGVAASRSRLIPEGRYILVWRPVEREGMAIRVRVRTPEGMQPVSGGRFEAEFSIREGRLSGCTLADLVHGGPAFGAECTMTGGTVVVQLGRGDGSGARMWVELTPAGADSYEGDLKIRSPMLPGVGLDIGHATMTPIR